LSQAKAAAFAADEVEENARKVLADVQQKAKKHMAGGGKGKSSNGAQMI
jgi:hypothetical protein